MVQSRKSRTNTIVLATITSFFLCTGAAHAAPVQWFFYDLTFEDGATGTGSFFFDADVSSGFLGAYSSIDLTVSGGSVFPDTTYNGIHPSSGSVDEDFMWFLVDSILLPGNFTFAAALETPMTAAGGDVFFTTTGDPSLFSQSVCVASTTTNCALGGTPQNAITGGYVSTTPPVPLPAAIWLFGSALLGAGFVSRRKK